MKKIFCLLATCIIFINSIAQTDSCHLQISLLTCSPGTELYSTFGHSAIRVKDSTGMDIIFNYGTFDFNDPDFYAKFVRGKLNYFVSVEYFTDFFAAYQYEQRGIIEQTLQLTCTQKQQLFEALKTNAKEENKFYKYDFLYDNCSSRLRDMIAKHALPGITYKNILPDSGTTPRNLIHGYLDAGHQPWSKLGIDILLGAKLDAPLTNQQAMFLPDYLLKGFDSAYSNNQAVVNNKKLLLPATAAAEKTSNRAPFIYLGVLFIIIAVASFIPAFQKLLQVFDYILFTITGLLGLLLLFMWWGTDHVVCSNNLNLLWALPTHLLLVFYLRSKKQWVNYYWLAVVIINGLLLMLWNWLPQQLNTALIPVVALLLLRSFMLFKTKQIK
ncbi:MAG: DUF4105 domain-containing protein [Flavihumibacter sp.]|nr:DUF4105 domain-containing protein [Flavihumibacter sp.]